MNDTLASATATATDKAAATAELAAIKVSFINETDFEALSGRGNRYATPNHIHTMVIKGMNLTVAGKDAIYGKLVGHTDRYTDKTIFDVELANGTTRTFTTYTVTGIDADWERGAIYKIVESKTTDNLATSVEKVAFTANYAEIESIQGGKYVFVDGTHKYQTNSTQVFGSTPRAGQKIAYLVDSTFKTDMVIIVNPGYVGTVTPPTTTGVVTYNDGTLVYRIDNGTPVIFPADGILVNISGTSFVGPTAALGALSTGDVVDVSANGKVITVTSAASVEIAKVTALTGTLITQAQIDAARTQYNKLNAEAKKLPAAVAELKLIHEAELALVFAMPVSTKAEATSYRAAYEALPADTKAATGTTPTVAAVLSKLTTAEAGFVITDVDALITAIPALKTDPTYVAKANAAKTAYQALTTVQKGLLADEDKMLVAIAQLEAFAIVAEAKADLELKFDAVNNIAHIEPIIKAIPATHTNTATYTPVKGATTPVGNTVNGADPGPYNIIRGTVDYTFDIVVTIGSSVTATDSATTTVTDSEVVTFTISVPVTGNVGVSVN